MSKVTVFVDDLANIDKQCVIMQVDDNILIMRLQKADLVRNFMTTYPKATISEVVAAMGNKGFIVAPSQNSHLIYSNGELVVTQSQAQTQSQPLSAAALTNAAAIVKEMGGLRNTNKALERVRKLIATCGGFERAEEAIKHLDAMAPSPAKKEKPSEGQSLAPEDEATANA